jgi:hypothetical protein
VFGVFVAGRPDLGRDEVAAFLRRYALADIKRWQLIPTSANGQPALAGYL